ncbi:hypothetical protein Goshw_005820 [Gossypium schwendimanii]|uniref:Uncharacterized protein n=1 Tax=Gossypium schwendimanii TaxID=34291 RepID=A0A7J9LTP7_GOSSC|nr:hypothetical protein [Gossypium schwendimanii]
MKELVATPRRENISVEKWMAILQTSNEGLLGLSLMRFCTDVETSTGSLYSGYEELLDMPLYFQESTQPIEEQLQVIPSELEIIKQYFEKRSSELKKDRTVGRGKGAARIRRQRPEVRSRENEKMKEQS